MPSRTTQPTEADLEADISKVLQQAFPTLSAVNIRHQLSFRIRLGRKTHKIESGVTEWAAGRCDLLLTKGDRPLAILELKRPGIAITDDDRGQGLSYARLIEPWPPLVIVSNTDQTRIYETFSGQEWQPSNRDEAALSDLLETSATLAQSNLTDAVQTLLGTSEKCWTSVVRSFTQEQVDRLTGPWDDLLAPFPEGFLLPRKATALLSICLETSDRVPVVIGPPLSGKSNVLREFVQITADSANFAALYLDADSSKHGIFQTIANLMTQSLGWSFDANQARTWLYRLSLSGHPPALVLMVDGGGATSMKAELDELASGTYGPNLRLVVSVDQGMVKQLLTSTTGRQRTALGTKAVVIEIKPLDDEEFEVAESVMYDLRFAFMHGSRHAADYRTPWLLRSFVAMLSSEPQFADATLAAAIPSVPGMQPMQFADERFGHDAVLKGHHLKIAEAMLEDVEAVSVSLDLSLLRARSFVCRLETLKHLLSDNEITELVSNGYLKHHVIGNDRIIVPQLPTFVASCACHLLASRIATDIGSDSRGVADWLVAICSRLPFGEILGAQALYRSASIMNGIPDKVIERLLEREPVRKLILPGTNVVTLVQGQRVHIEVVDERRIIAVFPDGERHELSSDPDESPPRAQSDVTPWLILSHFAVIPFVAINRVTNKLLGRVDAKILLDVGSCRIVLKRPERDMPDQITVPELGDDTVIVCHQEGIIEPITFSLYTAMTRDRQMASDLVEEAIERSSLPLLNRINIGLLQIEQQADSDKAEWAARLRSDKVLPRFRDTILDH